MNACARRVIGAAEVIASDRAHYGTSVEIALKLKRTWATR